MRIRRIAITLAAVVWVQAGLLWSCGIPSPELPVLFSVAVLTCLGLLTIGAMVDSRGRFLLLMLVAIAATEAGVVTADLVLRKTGILFYRSHERFARLYPEHPYLLRYRPNVRYESRTYGDLAAMAGEPTLREWRVERFWTDSHGFRNDPRLERSTNFQVVVVGDSLGLGSGTTQDKTWVSRLAREQAIPVYNLSQVGNPYEYCLNLKLEWPRLRLQSNATVLLVLFSGNDMAGQFGSEFDPSKLPMNGPWQARLLSWTTFRNRSPLRNLFTRWYRRESPYPSARLIVVRPLPTGPLLFFQPYADLVSVGPDQIRRHPNYGGFSATLREMARWCRAKDLKLVVLILPTKEETHAWILNRDSPWSTASIGAGFASVVVELCRSLEVPCLDAGPYLRGAARERYEKDGGWLWWRDDTHFNEDGHAAVATFVADALRIRLTPGTSSPP